MNLKIDNNLNVASQNLNQSSTFNNASRTIEDASKNLASAQRLTTDKNPTIQDVGQIVMDVAKLIDSASRFIKEIGNSTNGNNIGNSLNNAGNMFLDAANLMENAGNLINKLNKSNLKDASQSYQDGQNDLRSAASNLTSVNDPNLAVTQASQNAVSASQNIERGIRQTEQAMLNNSVMSTPWSSAKKVTEISDRPTSFRPITIPTNNTTSSPTSNAISNTTFSPTSNATQTSILTSDGKLSPELKTQIKEKLNTYIERNIDTILFDKLKLQPSYSGQFSRAGEANKTFGKGVSINEVKDFANSGIRPYGTEGRTLVEGNFSRQFGQINQSTQGRFGSAFINGETNVGGRGRVFGDISLKDRRAIIGAEGEIGARATYEASYSSPRVRLAGQEVALDANVLADVFVGANGRGKLEVSLKGNEPRIAVGGEVFAGARATIEGGIGATINGQQVAEAHARAEGWAGIGAKGDIDLGFEDGKFTFDAGFGAALGIGGSVDLGFSIDVAAIGNGIANGVENVVENTIDNIEDLGKDLTRTAAKVAEEIEDVIENAQEIGENISDAVENIGDKIGDVAENVGDAIGNAAKGAGKAIGGFFKSIF